MPTRRRPSVFATVKDMPEPQRGDDLAGLREAPVRGSKISVGFLRGVEAVADIAATIDDVGMTQDGEKARGELRDQSVAGVELQLFSADEFSNGRLYSSRVIAPRRRRSIDRAARKGWRDA